MPAATTEPTDHSSSSAAPPDREIPTIVTLYCRDEPDRPGESAPLPNEGIPHEFGRYDPTEIAMPPVEFCQQRGSERIATPPLRDRSISRRQLQIIPRIYGVQISNLGRGELLINGRTARKENEPEHGFHVPPGSTFGLRDKYLALVTHRRLLPLVYFDPHTRGPFGERDRYDIVGESPALWALLDRLAFAAKAKAHVLLRGDSGTGKELAARTIHALLRGPQGPYVARSMATIPLALMDAELFGHAAGYTHQGQRERPGLVGEADGGTLFLDEIGEATHEVQGHLLRLLDEGECHRLGESRMRKARLRLIGATNRDPSTLKHDLFARLTVRIEMPTLDQRREDIPLLVRQMVLDVAKESPALAERFVIEGPGGRKDVRMEMDLIDALVRYPAYAGNVRELRSLVLTAIERSRGKTLEAYPELLAERRAPPSESISGEREVRTVVTGPGPARAHLDPAALEARLRVLIDGSYGCIEGAAKELGMTRDQVKGAMRRFEIKGRR